MLDLSRKPLSKPFQRYGVAVLSVAIAAAIRLLIDPFITFQAPFVLLFGAIMGSALYGGLAGGLLATVLAILACVYFFIPPFYSFWMDSWSATLPLGLFFAEGVFISQTIAALLTAQKQVLQGRQAVQKAYAELEQKVKVRTAELAATNQALEQEIGERQRAEMSLREGERRFRAIFDNTFQFTGLMQPDGVLIEANQTALDFAGLLPADVIGKPFWLARWWSLSRETQDRVQQAIARAAAGEFIRFEVEVLGRGETTATIDFSIKPVLDETGQVILLIPEGRDITPVKQAEQTLRSFFDSASMMMGIVELVGETDIRHIADNQSTARFFNKTPDVMRDRLASEIGIPFEHIQEWIHYYRLAEETQAPVQFDYSHTTSSQQRWLSATVCAISKRGPVSRFAYIVEDITDRKLAQLELQQAETEVRRLNEELEQRVVERTRQLEAAIQEQQIIQAALRESQERFRQLAETVDDVFWLVDIRNNFQVLYVNPAYERIWGRSRESLYADTEAWIHGIHPDDQERVKTIFQEQMVQGDYDIDYRIMRPDHSIRWIRDRAFPVRDAAGDVYRIVGLAEDITDRKQIEEALLESESRLSLAQESARAGSWDWDMVTNQVKWSTEYYTLYGIPADTQPSFDNWMQAVYPEDRERIEAEMLTAVQTHTPINVEFRSLRPDSKVVWLNAKGRVLYNSVNQPIRMIGITFDISDRKQIEEALKLSEERFRIALQNSPLAVFHQDRDLRYTWIYNPKLGYTAQEVIGKTDADLMSLEDAAFISAIKRQVMVSGKSHRQEVHASRSGESFYYDLTVEPLRNDAGEIVGITASSFDITDLKRTQLELQIRARQQAAIAQLGREALSTNRLDQTMQQAAQLIAQTLEVEFCQIMMLVPNHQELKMHWGFGWQPEIVGQATFSAGANSQAGYTLMTSEPVLVTDLRQETRFKGSPILHQHHVISGVSVQIADQHEKFGVLGVHTTRSRHFSQDDVNFLQAAANILTETLQRQRSQKTLEHQSQELMLANRLKEEFLATISHELRTPLNAMVGWAKLLPSRNLNPETRDRALEVIARNTQSLAQLVEDVLDMSDILTGQLQLQTAPVALDLIIGQAIAAVHLAAEAKNIQIESHFDPDVGLILGDATRLQQAIWNLLSNAIKFTPEGGRVKVKLESFEFSVLSSQFKDSTQTSQLTTHNSNLTTQNLQRYAQITIADTGKGISPDFLPFVFDRFRQEDGSRTRKYGGLGLGLSIVRYLIEQHGGTVKADSPGEGQGATFTIRLPILTNDH